MSNSNTPMTNMPDAARLSSKSGLPEASVPQLPPLSINSLTQVQLKQLILVLMKAVSNKELATTMSHPCWWPPNVPGMSALSQTAKGPLLADSMKAVVRSYYRHLGQENMLSGGKVTNWRLSLAKLQALQLRQAEQLHGARTGSRAGKPIPGQIPFVGIYMCFFCSEEFVSKDDMRKHQLTCQLKPENMQKSGESPSSNSSRSPGKTPSGKTSPGLRIIIPQNNMSINQFMKKLDLVPQAKARKLRESCRKSTEVNTIDFSDPQVPISPSTPKTPKLLISQDSSLNKRRLSLSCQSQKESSSDTESTTSSENEEHEGKRRVIKSTSLFSIPVTSELGSRVLKHMVSDAATPHVLTNVEEFCKTPKKNTFTDRLRVRENAFPISYKPRKRYRFTHSYKFSKVQRDEFLLTLKTGLDRKSRKLMRSLPKCSVRLVRLTPRQLRKYVRKPKTKKKCVEALNPVVSVTKLNDSYFFPRKPILLNENIDSMLGLRKKTKKLSAKLSPMNVVSENTNVDLLKQKVVVYRSLLTDLSMSTARQKLQFSQKCERRMKKAPSKDESASEIVAHKYLQAKLNLHSAEKKTCNSITVNPQFPHLTELLGKKPIPTCALSPASIDSSPESLKSLDCPLNIDIPSPESSLTNFLLTCDDEKRLREHLSPDRISIMTVSSDDSSLHEHCCLGCQLRKQCQFSPNKSEVKDMESVTCTPCRIQLQNVNTVSCNNIESSTKEQGKSSVPNSSYTSVGNKIQTRSGSSVSSSLGVKRQTSAPAGSSSYSLRSNPTIKVDSTGQQENLTRWKTSKNHSEELSYPKKKSLVESPETQQQHSLLTISVEDVDTNLKNKTHWSNPVSLPSRHLSISDSLSKSAARPSTRSCASKIVQQSENSSDTLSLATSNSDKPKENKMSMTTRSSCVKETDSEAQKSKVSDRPSGHFVRSLNFGSVTENKTEREGADSFTRVDSDIFLKNVHSVSSRCKQKLFDSQTVKEAAHNRRLVGTVTRSKTDNSYMTLKRRKFDL